MCDFDGWVAGFGERKNEFIGKELTKWAVKLLKDRDTYLSGGEREGELIGTNPEFYVAMAPSVSGGDCFGGLCIVSEKEITREEISLMKICAKIIGEYMQKF